MLLVILTEKKLLDYLRKKIEKKKKTKKTKQKDFRPEKVMKRKYDKLYVKWKGYDRSFNSWTDRKDII